MNQEELIDDINTLVDLPQYTEEEERIILKILFGLFGILIAYFFKIFT